MGWVVLTDDWEPQVGGVSTWSRWAVDALCSKGPVRVYTRARGGRSIRRSARLVVTEVRAPHFTRHGPWAVALRALSALRRCDAILATTWPMAVGATRLAPPNTPIHVVLHGSDTTTRPLGRAFRRVGQRCRVWAVSAYLAGLARAAGVRAEVLPVPIPVAPVATGEDWGMVARATRWKGGDRFVRLVAEAGVRGHVVGDGPQRMRWESLARKLGAAITFHGALSPEGVEAVYRRCERVFLLSRPREDGSGAEGLGLVLLEAAARGLAPIGAPTGGIPEAASLVLERPDDARASLARMRRWWTPERGTEARARLLRTHGVEPFLDRVCRT